MTAPPRMPGSYLVLELTNRCSLACVHCSVSEEGHPHHARTGYLDPRLADSLFDDLAAVGARFDTLILFWLGEPLLHPHFTRIWRAGLRGAARNGIFGKVEVHSNATHLSADRVAAFLNDGAVPSVLHLSLDAASEATYRAVKGMDRFARVQANVEALVAAKGRTGARWPRVVFQFIVGSNNVADAAPFRAHWEAVCRRAGVPVRAAAGHVPPGDDAVVFFRQLDCPTVDEQLRENALFRAEMARQGLALPPAAARGEAVAAHNLQPCSGFWKSPVVGWQGDVTVCTRDNHLDNRIGNLHDHAFRRLWWGGLQGARRAAVAAGDYGALPLCQTCFIPRSLNHAELSAADIAAEATFAAAGGCP